MNKIKIGNRPVGKHFPVFIIAEIGINHNGDFNLAKKLIDEAIKCGADAVKFQTFRTEKLVSKNTPLAEYQRSEVRGQRLGISGQYELLKKLELTYDDFVELKKYCDKKNVIFLSTPFDEESADFLYNIGVPAFKISSGDLTNLPLLNYIAKKKLPMIISTGMANLKEVKEAVDIVRNSGCKKIILFHCVSSYPAKFEECNLSVIPYMIKKFNLLIGFSDHTPGVEASICAATLGAKVIEKHFTLSKGIEGPDHKCSLDKDEFKLLISSIRNTERAIGKPIKKIQKSEIDISKVVRKSMVAKINIKKETVIKKEHLAIKRPATGIKPKYINKIIGKKAKRDIFADEIIKWEDIF